MENDFNKNQLRNIRNLVIETIEELIANEDVSEKPYSDEERNELMKLNMVVQVNLRGL